MKAKIILLIMAVGLPLANSFAQEQGYNLGDKIDGFEAVNQDGDSWNLKKFLGKNIREKIT